MHQNIGKLNESSENKSLLDDNANDLQNRKDKSIGDGFGKSDEPAQHNTMGKPGGSDSSTKPATGSVAEQAAGTYVAGPVGGQVGKQVGSQIGGEIRAADDGKSGKPSGFFGKVKQFANNTQNEKNMLGKRTWLYE